MFDDAMRRLFIALTCITLSLAIYRRFIADSADPYHCTALLNEGRWIDEPTWRPSFNKWQPPGCLMHEYTSNDVVACSEGRQMLFAGDSNVRQLFWAVARKLNQQRAIDMWRDYGKHRDIDFEDRGVRLRYVWDPMLNSTTLADELDIYRENIEGTRERQKQDSALIILGAGLWHARQFGTSEAVREFKASVNRVVSYTSQNHGRTWRATKPFHGWEGIDDQIVFLPVEEPAYGRLSPARQDTILPEEINQMNQYLKTLTPAKGLMVSWANQAMVHAKRKRFTFEASGLHVIESISTRRADVILNMRCNAKVDNVVGSPYERTCCAKYTNGNWFQWLLLAITLLAIPSALLVNPGTVSGTATTKLYSLASSLLILGLAVAYCFFADRSQLLSKVLKTFYATEFRLLSIFALVTGLATIRPTKEARARKTSTDMLYAPVASTFLPREQADEWKGWMSIFVLLYHWTASDGHLGLYITLRLVIASYLFITAYSHTMFFYQHRDYSLRRVSEVLIRLNMLPILLSYQMYNKYMVYEFPALASFWFLVGFVTLRIGSGLNDKPGPLLMKVAVLCCMVVLSHVTTVPTNALFELLRSAFRVDWKAGDWRQLIILDQYIPFVGILVALLHTWYHHASISTTSMSYYDCCERHWASRVRSVAMPYLRPAAIISSLAVVPVFILLIGRSPDREDYHWWSAIISPVPILSYLILRNAHPLLRDHYSAVFAWLGRRSAEIWVLSFHILRAADGRGVLSLGVFGAGDGSLSSDRWKDAILLMPILIWTSAQVHSATRKITTWFVEGNAQKRFAGLMGALWLLNLATA